MQGLPFIELAEEAPPLVRVGIPAEDMEGAGEAPLFWQRAGQRILLGIGLELLDEE